MVTYLLSLEKKEVLDISVRLFASHGNPDLYIKECSGFQGTISHGIDSVENDCLITEEFKEKIIIGE